MHAIKIEICDPKYGSTNRKYIYINNTPIGYVSLKDATKIDIRVRKMIAKYIKKYNDNFNQKE